MMRAQKISGSRTDERVKLEKRFLPLMEERLGMRQLVTYVPNKTVPIHRWFSYKEGFSAALVDAFLREFGAQPGKSRVFDPFVGCGTTVIVAKQAGYGAWGIDILPVAIFVAGVKLRSAEDYDLLRLKAGIDRLLDNPYHEPSISAPQDVRIIPLAFSEDILNEILFFKEEILKEEDESVREFLLLGLLSILEKVSYTSKDGQFLRLKPERNIPPVRTTLARQLRLMYRDLTTIGYQMRLFEKPAKYVVPSSRTYVLLADARDFTSTIEDYADVIITSPPYLNRYDYSRIYSLELCLAFVEDFAGLKEVRYSLLRSHIESRPAPTDKVNYPALLEVLSNLAGKKLNNPRIPIMIKGYFEDMNLVLKELYRVCRPGAKIALVVGNVRFEGELIPVDLLLSELASDVGFSIDKVIITRYKGNSSQQMGKYGRVPVRESVVLWSKG
jgi:DNA modification methylase